MARDVKGHHTKEVVGMIRREDNMKLLGAALVGIIAAISGLALNLDRPFLTNHAHISQAVAAESLQMNPAPGFTQKDVSKKPFRLLLNMFKSEPWRLSRHSK